MRASNLLLRCYAERTDDLWLAFCLDFSLGAQADTLDEARAKLDVQIREYLCDALGGQDAAHAKTLLPRRAPLSFWLKYGWTCALDWMAKEARLRAPVSSRSFREPIPMVPASC